MKLRTLLLAPVLLLAIAAAPRSAGAHTGGAPGSFGLGLVLGGPTGLTAELELSPATSLDFTLGFEVFDDDDDFYFHVTYLVHPVDLSRRGTLSVPLYIGLGAFLFDHGNFGGDVVDLGLRVPFGLELNFRRAPFQIFAELSVRVFLIDFEHDHGDNVDLEAALGFRIFF